MKPKNSKERRASFLKFLLLFVVTVVAILFAVYFNFKVPVKENAVLKEQVRLAEKEMKFQNAFANDMKAIKNMIDSLSISGHDSPYHHRRIADKLAELTKTIPTSDSVYQHSMYTTIIDTYLGLQEAKKRLSNLKDAESKLEEYKEELEKSRRDLKETEDKLFQARVISGQS
ncbi:type VI secretion system TssO [Hyunsoonleella rubra]|uniref:Type VI secretion system TssO n=1 Tax=Hyunsoonleella rubra TaxID=1737062 RepID=A0ABW5TDZ2_9FLAO